MGEILCLQSQSNHNDYALMNRITNEVKFYSKVRQPCDISSMNGFYETVNDKLCILFKYNKELFLKIDAEEFHITDETDSRFRKEGEHHIFELKRQNEFLIEIVYLGPKPEIPLEIDPTPFIEYEHFDFLFFIHNILMEEGRRKKGQILSQLNRIGF